MKTVPDPEELVSVQPGGAELRGPTAAPGPHDPYAALRHRDYRWYAIGSLVAAIGTNMQAVTVV